jgi:hypothetical protein
MKAIERSRSVLELGLMLLTGAGHVIMELVLGLQAPAARLSSVLLLYNFAAGACWGIYLWRRLTREAGLAACWGFRTDNLLPALRRSVPVVLGLALPMGLYAAWRGQLLVPSTFWASALLYPFYGLAQQAALQVLVTRNLRRLIPRRLARMLVVAAAFSLAHAPDGPLMGLTFIAALALTWLYESEHNLFVVGTAHGLLGALAYYWVLGRDPGLEILSVLGAG